MDLILDVREARLGEALTALQVPYTTAALDVGDARTLSTRNEIGSASHRTKCPHWGIHASGDDPLTAFEQRLVCWFHHINR